VPGTLKADQARELFEPRKQIPLYQAYLLQQRMLDVSEARTHTLSLTHTQHTHTPHAHTSTHAPHTNTPHTHTPHTHASSHASLSHTAHTHTPRTHILHTHAAHTHTSCAHTLGLVEGARRVVPMEERVMHLATSAHSHDHHHTATHYNTLQHTATHCNARDASRAVAAHSHGHDRTATHYNTLQHTATHCNTRDASRAVAAHSHEQTQQSEQPPNGATFDVSADPPRMQLCHQLERRRQSCMPQVLVCESFHSCEYVMSHVCMSHIVHCTTGHPILMNCRSLLQNIVSFTGLFCKRDL